MSHAPSVTLLFSLSVPESVCVFVFVFVFVFVCRGVGVGAGVRALEHLACGLWRRAMM